MARFKEYDRSQGLFLTVNLEEQLLPGTFEWTLDYLIDKMDMSLFEKNYHNDETGAKAYPPNVLLKIIIYSYSLGIISSRPIEKVCKTNIILKALAKDAEPDHDTIAAFISTNSEAVKDLFTQILLKCHELELITGEMFAIDGCKLPANVSKEWSGQLTSLKKKKSDLERLAAKILLQHRELDRNESAKKKQEPFRKTMGDDKKRRERHIKRIEKKLKRLERFLEEAEPKKGACGNEVQTNVTDSESAKIKGPHGYIQGYNGIAVADSGNQVIVCAEATGGSESGSFSGMLDGLEGNMKAVTGKEKPLKKSICLGDTGFFSEENLQEAAKRGIDVLIPDPQFRKRDTYFDGRKEHADCKKRYGVEDFKYDKKRDIYICPCGNILVFKGKIKLRNNEGKKYQANAKDCVKCRRIGKCIAMKNKEGKNHRRTLYIVTRKWEENLSEKMREKIDDAAYREIYTRRMQIIEPVFADITYCKGMDRFTMRTRKKVNIQWLLYCIVHNIGKCIKPMELKYG
jgi:transposase